MPSDSVALPGVMLNLPNARRGALPVRSPVIDQLNESTLIATAAMSSALSKVLASVKRGEQFRRSSVGRRGLRAHHFQDGRALEGGNCSANALPSRGLN
jgi:hypothetical protein